MASRVTRGTKNVNVRMVKVYITCVTVIKDEEVALSFLPQNTALVLCSMCYYTIDLLLDYNDIS